MMLFKGLPTLKIRVFFYKKKQQTYTNTLRNHIYFRDLLHIDQGLYKLNLNTVYLLSPKKKKKKT